MVGDIRWIESELNLLTGQMGLYSLNPPRPTLTVEPKSPVFTGESVTLKCEIQSYSNWRYQWYKGSSGTAVSQSQTNTFTIRSADQGQYWCRGERDDRPTSSQNSSAVTLTVKDQPEVIIKEPPGQTQVFTGETVTLQCKTEGGEDKGRSYFWYKNEQFVHSEWKREYTFQVTADHNAGFTCETRKSGTDSKESAPVRLSVS
ncbi:hypothetical protein NFI96_008440, partial [Prochilodus magdalenae]